MDPRFQSSFIPKKPIVAAPSRSSSTINLFSLLATVIFIVALALSVGVYFYQGIVQKQIDSASASLDRAKAAFEPDTINQIVRLDTRIETGKELLANHISVTPFFNLLSSMTLKTVRFKDFSFSYLAPDKIAVAMTGQAVSYAAVALESDLLNSQKSLSGTILSDLALNSDGTVGFNITTTVSQSLLAYTPDSDTPQQATTTVTTASAPANTNAQ